VNNRGCCSYYPKFSLLEIQRMSKSLLGLDTLDKIIKQPGTTVDRYIIKSTGDFDKSLYEEYIKNSDGILYKIPIDDKTIFFKTCPFVKTGLGCTISPRFRNSVCNFFICNEVLDYPELKLKFKPWIENRNAYMSWVYKENIDLQYVLYENNLNLLKNYGDTISFLQELPLNIYDFPNLEPIFFEDENLKGA